MEGDFDLPLPLLVAFLGGAVSLLGLLIKNIYDAYEVRRQYRSRRDDMQKALYAEISAFVVLQERNRLSAHRVDLLDGILNRNMIPFVVEDSHDTVFRALLSDIHYLPKETIDDITIYYHTIAQISDMQKSMTNPLFRELEAERRAQIYGDYIDTIQTALSQGKRALEYIKIFSEEGKLGVEEYKSNQNTSRAERQKYEVKAWINTQK